MAFAVRTMTRGFAAAPMGQREGARKSVGGNAKTGKELLFAAAEPGDGRSRVFEDIHLLVIIHTDTKHKAHSCQSAVTNNVHSGLLGVSAEVSHLPKKTHGLLNRTPSLPPKRLSTLRRTRRTSLMSEIRWERKTPSRLEGRPRAAIPLQAVASGEQRRLFPIRCDSAGIAEPEVAECRGAYPRPSRVPVTLASLWNLSASSVV